MNWQPIETAPKDGEYVLLYVPAPEGESDDMMISGWFDQGLNGGCWMVGDGVIAFEDATYWMPLPLPLPPGAGQ